MPKSNLLRTETARKNYASRARAGIKRHIELSKVSEDKIAAKQNVQVRTLMRSVGPCRDYRCTSWGAGGWRFAGRDAG